MSMRTASLLICALLLLTHVHALERVPTQHHPRGVKAAHKKQHGGHAMTEGKHHSFEEVVPNLDAMSGAGLAASATEAEMQLAKDQNRAPRRSEDIHMAKHLVYRTFLRAKRYLQVAPQNNGRKYGFTFMTGNNVKRAVKLGIKLALLGLPAIDSAHGAGDAAADLAHRGADTTELVVEITSLTVEYGHEIGMHVYEGYQHEPHPLAEPGREPGTYTAASLGGFADATLSLHLEAWLNFASHRNADGAWQMDQVEKTRKEAEEKGTMRSAAFVETAVNSKIATGVGLLYYITAIVLICIPEPATTVTGAGMLLGGTVYGFVAWTANATAGNLAHQHKLAHLTSILISYFAWEGSQDTLENQLTREQRIALYGEEVEDAEVIDCDITEVDHCPAGSVCQREYLYSGNGDESSLAHEFSPAGWCARYSLNGDRSGLLFPGENLPFGTPCQLHRDCSTGYCHFSSKKFSSKSMWKAILQFRDQKLETPEKMVQVFMDTGICVHAIKPTDDCPDRINGVPVTQVEISEHHLFEACVPTNLVADSDMQSVFAVLADAALPNVANANDPIKYGESVVMRYITRTQDDDTPVFNNWFNYPGNMNWFPVTRQYPDESLPINLRQDFTPQDLTTTPWIYASQFSFIKLACKTAERREDGNCKEYVYAGVGGKDTAVRYGDYIALASECTDQKAYIESQNREEMEKAGLLEPLEPKVTTHRYLYINWVWGADYYITVATRGESNDWATDYVWKVGGLNGDEVGDITPTSPFEIVSMYDGSTYKIFNTGEKSENNVQKVLQDGSKPDNLKLMYAQRAWRQSPELCGKSLREKSADAGVKRCFPSVDYDRDLA